MLRTHFATRTTRVLRARFLGTKDAPETSQKHRSVYVASTTFRKASLMLGNAFAGDLMYRAETEWFVNRKEPYIKWFPHDFHFLCVHSHIVR